MSKRFLSLLITISLCLTACVKESPERNLLDQGGSYLADTFGYAGDYQVLWNEGDGFVQLYEKSGGKLDYVSFELVSGAGTPSASFQTEAAPIKPLVSLYPSSFLDKDKITSAVKESIPVIWPSSQTYAGPGITACPMYSDGNDNGDLIQFKNIGGILKVTAKGEGKVKSVRLISSGTIAGKAVFEIKGAKIIFSEGEKEIVIDCGKGVELTASGIDFNFPVPCCSVEDARLIFTLDYSGKDVCVSRTIDETPVISAGKAVPANCEVTLDGALVSSSKPVVYPMSDIINLLASAIGQGLIKDESLSGIVASVVKPILSNNLPDKDYTKCILNYLTKDPSGKYIIASGVVSWPEEVASGKEYDRIVSVQHGTCDIDKAPSLNDFYPELAPVFHDGSRNIVSLADYLGYGASRTSTLEHPYMHAGMTGSACADMLRATENYLASETVFRYASAVSDKKPLGLIGYSQGGQGTIATLFTLQDLGYTDRIDEVRAGAGPLDLMSFIDSFRDKNNYNFMGYIPYMIRGMIYGDQLDVDLHNIYAPAVFNSGMDRNFNSSMLTTWHAGLGTDVHNVLHPDFFSDTPNTDLKKILDAAQRNSLIECGAPVNPSVVTLYHETNDEQVLYSCSVNASRKWGCKLENLTIVDNVHFMGAVEFYFRYLGEDVWENVHAEIEPLLPMMVIK